jgi:hypothetical protein
MTRNIGGGERTVRWVAGVVLVAVALLLDLEPGWALLAFLLGIGALATSLVCYCPVNAALRRDSRRHAPRLR